MSALIEFYGKDAFNYLYSCEPQLFELVMGVPNAQFCLYNFLVTYQSMAFETDFSLEIASKNVEKLRITYFKTYCWLRHIRQHH